MLLVSMIALASAQPGGGRRPGRPSNGPSPSPQPGGGGGGGGPAGGGFPDDHIGYSERNHGSTRCPTYQSGKSSCSSGDDAYPNPSAWEAGVKHWNANPNANPFSDTSADVPKYNAKTGKYQGEMLLTRCLPDSYVRFGPSPGYSCQTQRFPPQEYKDSISDTCSGWGEDDEGEPEGPHGAGYVGRVGLTFSGVQIYGPFEAGFGSSTRYACGNNDGFCTGGLAAQHCEDGLKVVCPLAGKSVSDIFLDECGGHTGTYHLHGPAACEPGMGQKVDNHPAAVGIALDGYAIYGLYDDHNDPENLDACGGHSHAVPGDAAHGIEAGDDVYHYHFQGEAPFTLGCFGPVDTIDHCKALYEGCGAGFVELPSGSQGSAVEYTAYDEWCPCFKGYNKFTKEMEYYNEPSKSEVAAEMGDNHGFKCKGVDVKDQDCPTTNDGGLDGGERRCTGTGHNLPQPLPPSPLPTPAPVDPTPTPVVPEPTPEPQPVTPAPQPEKPEQPQKPEKPEQPEHPERPEQPEHPEKPEQPEHPERPEQPEHPEKPEQPERPERPQPERPVQPEPEQPEKPSPSPQPEPERPSPQPERPERPVTTSEPEPERPERPIKTTSAPSRPERPTTTASSRPERPIRTTDAPSRPERPISTTAAPSRPERPIRTTGAPSRPERPISTTAAPSRPERPIRTTAAPSRPSPSPSRPSPSPSRPSPSPETTTRRPRRGRGGRRGGRRH